MAVHTGQSYCDLDICIGAPHVEQLRTVPKARDVEDSVIFYLRAAPTRPDIYYFCIYHHTVPVGQILLHDINIQTGESLIGYHLFHSDYRGQGIGTAALRLLQAHVHATTALTRLIIITGRDNTASQRVATKCGFRLIGPAREEPEHLIVYAWDVPRPTLALGTTGA